MAKVCSCSVFEREFGNECGCPDLMGWMREAIAAMDSRGSYAAAAKDVEYYREMVSALMRQEVGYLRTINGLMAERDALQQALNDLAVHG
jgi:hypothetical protein